MQKSGVTSKVIGLAVASLLGELLPRVRETLSDEVMRGQGLASRAEALRAIHFPRTADEAARARYRMKFEEFFYMQLALLRRKVIRSTRWAVISMSFMRIICRSS